MDRRSFMKTMGAAGAACTLPGCRSLLSERSGELPNIVYILTDDMGYGDVSILNPDSKLQTAHMDRLAREGMLFTDAHSGSAVCTPTRYGVLTGRYCWRTQLKKGVLSGFSEHLIDPKRTTVASLLKRHAYHTACIGKWHLGWDWARPDGEHIDFTKPVTNGPDANGFDYYYAFCGSLDMPPYVYVENGEVTAQPNRETVNQDAYGFWRKGQTGADFDHEDVLPNFTRRGVSYIKERAATGKPFFLYLPFPAPHTPILPTKEFQGKSGTNAYGDFVLQVDWSIGQVTKALRESGVADNTLIVVTSDNGCSSRANFDVLAEFGHDPSYVYRGQKTDIFEGGHRIPLIARWPGRIKPGSVCDDTTCLTDLLATCSEIVGDTLPNDAGEDSVSMLPNLLGTAEGPLHEATVHHSVYGEFSIRRGKWKLELCPGSGGRGDPRRSKAEKMGLPPLQLYDLQKDVGETTNLQNQFPEIVEELTALLEKYKREGRSVRR